MREETVNRPTHTHICPPKKCNGFLLTLVSKVRLPLETQDYSGPLDGDTKRLIPNDITNQLQTMMPADSHELRKRCVGTWSYRVILLLSLPVL